MWNAVRNLVGHGVRWKLRRQLRRMLQQAADCRGVQQSTLRRLLRLNGDSRFSIEHGLQRARTPQEFARIISIAGFERATPYVERVKQGEPGALLGSRNPLLMFALTSGTTNGSKFIPITKQFLCDYRRGWQVWGGQAFDDHPQMHGQMILQICSDYEKFCTRSGVPCGNISGLVQRMQNRVVGSTFAIPPEALKISDQTAKQYFSLKHSLQYRNVGLITTANPSTLVQLFRMLDKSAESFVRDLHDGTDFVLSITSLPARSRNLKNVTRAKELDRLLQQHGTLRPRDVWPTLQLVAVWTGGSAAAYLPTLREFLGDLPIRDHGLHASEGRMTIPLEDETSSGLLDVGSHYFEFIPESEIASEQPVVLGAHELEVGKSYYIVLTTASGLYRYDIRDVVECMGHQGTTPLLRFLHKGANIGNLTGEKLTESQVVQAVTAVSKRMHIRLDYFTAAPEWRVPPRYALLAEDEQFASTRAADSFALQVDDELLRLNLEYQEKRHTDRLAPLTLIRVPGRVWRNFVTNRQSKICGSLEQYKHPFLVPKLEFLDEFNQSYASAAAH